MTRNTSVPDQQLPDDLISEMASLSSKVVSADFLILVDALKSRFGSSLEAVLLYGSCLRSHEIGDGVVDFYAVVNSYSEAYPEHYLAVLNAWLPPNVFFLEASVQEKKFRAKYAVVTMADFEQGTQHWFHPYLWARFAQPSRLLYARDEMVRTRVNQALAHAVVTFLKSSLPLLESSAVSAETIWTNGLTQTYAAELRPERSTRARQLVELNLDDYARLTRCAVSALAETLEVSPDGNYRCLTGVAERRRSLRLWRLRRWQGKVLSVLRLSKAAFTFHDSINYAAWKIERHTGVRVEVTPLLRRHPLLWGLKVSWQLLRRGVMR
jgi:hypothetical protein